MSGLTCKIEVTGFTEGDVEQAVEEALRLIKQGNLSGFNSNETGAFTFEISGDALEEADCIKCGQSLYRKDGVWIDGTGGDGCSGDPTKVGEDAGVHEPEAGDAVRDVHVIIPPSQEHSMSSDPYFRTVLIIEVLTAHEAWNGSAEELGEDITTGNASGMVLTRVVEQCSEAEIAELLIAQGSAPGFLIPDREDEDSDEGDLLLDHLRDVHKIDQADLADATIDPEEGHRAEHDGDHVLAVPHQHAVGENISRHSADAQSCVYCGKQPQDPGFDRCFDCRTWRDEEWCEERQVEHCGDLARELAYQDRA